MSFFHTLLIKEYTKLRKEDGFEKIYFTNNIGITYC